MMKKIFNSKGFTLIELAIYMGILSILLLVLTNFFLSALDTQLESKATSPIEQDSKFILNKFFYDVGNADNITLPATAGAKTDTLILVRNSQSYTYRITGNNLTITDDSGTDVLNSPGSLISNLTFTRISYVGQKPTVRIMFTASSSAIANSGQSTQAFQTTIGLR